MSTRIPEVGIILYPGSQAAAILGMTDLLTYAEDHARGKRESDGRLLRVSHGNGRMRPGSWCGSSTPPGD